jgi:hypothetical protein
LWDWSHPALERGDFWQHIPTSKRKTFDKPSYAASRIEEIEIALSAA